MLIIKARYVIFGTVQGNNTAHRNSQQQQRLCYEPDRMLAVGIMAVLATQHMATLAP